MRRSLVTRKQEVLRLLARGLTDRDRQRGEPALMLSLVRSGWNTQGDPRVEPSALKL